MNSNEMCGCGTEEKTSSAKGIVRINYKEDFELVVELLAGDKPYQLGDEDFRIDFIVMASRYTVGRTAGVCERCAVDGNKVRCFMDGHDLPPGELRAEVKVNTPDPNYADGKRLNVAIAEGTVVLVKDNTRFDGAVIKANIPVALVDAYQLAKAHGYKGTIDEYYATFNDVSALLESVRGMAEEERKRSTAETERAKEEKKRNNTEKARNENEQQRQTNEDARNKAEKERQTAEKERATAEGKRADTDKERDELVAKMQAAWQEIERMKNVREGEYGKEIELVEKIKNAAKIPTQNVWLDATDGQIKSTPASKGINPNAYKYYYIGRREEAKSSGIYTNKYLRSLDLTNWNTQAMANANYMFSGCSALQSIDVSNWNTQAMTSVKYMFNDCSALQSLDVSKWDTQALSDASYMFKDCFSLRIVDFRKANFNHVSAAQLMFNNCDALVELWLPLTFDLLTNIDLSIQSWGATTEGLASLRWTFGEGADDRTTKGLQPCTVSLHGNVYDRLTNEERAAAAKKGWTITK